MRRRLPRTRPHEMYPINVGVKSHNPLFLQAEGFLKNVGFWEEITAPTGSIPGQSLFG